LSYGTPTHDGFKVAETATGFQVTTFGNVQASDVHVTSVTDSMIQVSGTVDGYQLNLAGHSNQDATPTPYHASVGLDATVTALNGATPTGFSYYVGDTPFTFPGSAGSTNHVYASVQTSGDYVTGDVVQAQAQVNSFGPNTTPQSYLTGTAGPLGGLNQSATSNIVTIPSGGAAYTLSVLGSFAETPGNLGTMHFLSQATATMPEPSGVVIGLLGVPFVGGLIFLARRRSAGAPVLA
jgi:hypothetical protein